MPGRRYNERRIDGVGIHAALVVVMHAHERPIGDHAGDANTSLPTIIEWASNEIFDSRGVEELDVRELENLGEERRCEESGVFDDDIIVFLFVGNAKISEKGVGGFAHDHCGEELTTEPGPSS